MPFSAIAFGSSTAAQSGFTSGIAPIGAIRSDRELPPQSPVCPPPMVSDDKVSLTGTTIVGEVEFAAMRPEKLNSLVPVRLRFP
ncbi:hypothetical protein Mal33_52130 [Rosistilla oblonga]|uniref:Uncharacterized protein n=1 Tax=Rosistilla oblonga TaxID=2527990 RepID=A0A518J1I4_9BACT|nr:hypothetical protein Mal33_52130 [Rosistilla oblonga]